MRSYDEYCAIAKSLDVIGDRWTLLIVRELAVRGACRYTDVRNGLGEHPRTLPPKWFYDKVGSDLFVEITRLPEYYPTRAESEILRRAGDRIAACSGAFVNCDLAGYLVPVHADIPVIDAAILDGFDDKANVLGVKGLGELGICGAGAAVGNAVFNATGVRGRDFPITLDKLLPALPQQV